MARFSGVERSPAPSTLRAVRLRHNLTQIMAARLIRKTEKYWHRCEKRGTPMHEGLFELFCIKLGEDFEALIEAPPEDV